MLQCCQCHCCCTVASLYRWHNNGCCHHCHSAMKAIAVRAQSQPLCHYCGIPPVFRGFANGHAIFSSHFVSFPCIYASTLCYRAWSRYFELLLELSCTGHADRSASVFVAFQGNAWNSYVEFLFLLHPRYNDSVVVAESSPLPFPFCSLWVESTYLQVLSFFFVWTYGNKMINEFKERYWRVQYRMKVLQPQSIYWLSILPTFTFYFIFHFQINLILTNASNYCSTRKLIQMQWNVSFFLFYLTIN